MIPHLKPALALAAVGIAALSAADIHLGSFTFNENQFGDTLIEPDNGEFSASGWLNVVDVDPGNPGYLTGANFDTGIANIGMDTPLAYRIGYNTPIVNEAGLDLGIVVARYSADDILIRVTRDGVNWGPFMHLGWEDAVDTGVHKDYYYSEFLQGAELYVHALDLGAFGLKAGQSVVAIEITGSTELDLIRVAGMNKAVPEPASIAALGIGAFGLLRRRARRSSQS